MSELENLESINAFVDYAFNQANQAYELMGKVSKKIQSGRVGRKEAIDSLVALLEYANNYNILDDIDASDIDDYFSGSVEEIMNKKPDQMTAQDKLTFAINTRNRIKSQVNNQGIELMADFLLDYAPESVEEKVSEQIAVFRQRIEGVKDNPKNKPEFIAKRTKELQDQIDEWQNFTLDKANLVKFLKEAVRDEAIVDYLFTSLISSNDSVLALFARAVKTELEDARMKDIKIQRELQKAFDEYQRVAPGSRDNPKSRSEYLLQMYGRDDAELGRILDKIPQAVNEEAAGVGVVANKKQARDPRYSMSITKDVRPGEVGRQLKKMHLADSVSQLQEQIATLKEKWSAKYKRSINCNRPRGFSQRAHCAGRKK